MPLLGSAVDAAVVCLPDNHLLDLTIMMSSAPRRLVGHPIVEVDAATPFRNISDLHARFKSPSRQPIAERRMRQLLQGIDGLPPQAAHLMEHNRTRSNKRQTRRLSA